ncbi:hypothetical protein ACWDR0_32950 [Streptomyces sp. NPDC003691]
MAGALIVDGFLEIRTVSRGALSGRDTDTTAAFERIAEISNLCHSLPVTTTGGRREREERAAHALGWRYTHASESGRAWVRAVLRARGAEYEHALEEALKRFRTED